MLRKNRDMDYKTLINYLQTANINFLIGSGASRPFLETLGDVEVWLTELAKEGDGLTEVQKKALRASIYKSYFDKAIGRNQTKLPNDCYKDTIKQYALFLSTLNEILNRRGNRLTPKQVNLFTTNIDTLIENAVEEVGVEFNDGFKGTVNQIFDESNFRKSISKASLHFQSVAELPVFNTERRSDAFIISKIKEIKAMKLRDKRRKENNIDDMKNKDYHI